MTEITVIICTYNREETLARAIESVLEQTVDDFEMLIIDDGSTDRTARIIKRYEHEDDRVRSITHDRNRGTAAARNTGIETAAGDYISFLDSDDKLKPTFLERSRRVVTKMPPSCAGTHVALEYQKDGEYHGVFEADPVVPAANQIGTRPLDLARMGGLMIRSSVFDTVGLFDERFEYAEDTDYWIRLLQRYWLAGITEPLYVYHLHNEQLTQHRPGKARGWELLLSKHTDQLTPRAIATHRLKLANLYVSFDSVSKAADELQTVVNDGPQRGYALCLYVGLRIDRRLYRFLWHPTVALTASRAAYWKWKTNRGRD